MSKKETGFRENTEIVEGRYSTERAYEARETYEKRIMQMNAKTPLDIPEHEVPNGVRYLWVRSSVYGEPDVANMAQMAYYGWKIVPSSRHVKHIVADPLNREQHLTGCLHYKGLVLHEREEYLCELEDRRLQEDSLSQLAKTKGLENEAQRQIREFKKHFKYNPFTERQSIPIGE